MAAAFNTSVSSLEDELTQLILDGQISARIDSHAKVHAMSGHLVAALLEISIVTCLAIMTCFLADHVCTQCEPAQCCIPESP